MKLIFLDIDGVLNDHRKIAGSNLCGINPINVERFNRLLRAVPSAQIIVSSAWRYMVIGGDMTLKGFEYMLATHGVACTGRIIGTTEKDGPLPEQDEDEPEEDWLARLDAWGVAERVRQINAAIEKWNPTSWVVLDDLPLDMDRFVRTDFGMGLVDDDIRQALKILDSSEKAAVTK